MIKIARYVLFFTTFVLISSCSGLNQRFNLKDDHPAEEILEGFINKYLDVDVDLSQETPENIT